MSLWDGWIGNIITALGAGIVSVGATLTVMRAQIAGTRYDVQNIKKDVAALERRLTHVERHYAQSDDVRRGQDQILDRLNELHRAQQQILLEMAHLWKTTSTDVGERGRCAPSRRGIGE